MLNAIRLILSIAEFPILAVSHWEGEHTDGFLSGRRLGREKQKNSFPRGGRLGWGE